MTNEPTHQDFANLLQFLVELRRFQRGSEEVGRAHGVTYTQQQLLIAVKGHPGPVPPSVGDIAGYLMLQPNSALELVNRAQVTGLVSKAAEEGDQRITRVVLTSTGNEVVLELGAEIILGLGSMSDSLSRMMARAAMVIRRAEPDVDDDDYGDAMDCDGILG